MNLPASFHLLVKRSNFLFACLLFVFYLNNPKCCEINWVKKKSYSESQWPKARLLKNSLTLQDGNILISMTKLNCTQEWEYLSPIKWFLNQQFCSFTALRNKDSDFFMSVQTELPRKPFTDFFITFLLQPLLTWPGRDTSLVGIFTLSKNQRANFHRFPPQTIRKAIGKGWKEPFCTLLLNS